MTAGLPGELYFMAPGVELDTGTSRPGVYTLNGRLFLDST